ncbi:MAG: hypothetical protein M3R00_05740, partial [Pseudomonadota bacterium]|nr:hypothetical protein [Pseudomonadota bacterium]
KAGRYEQAYECYLHAAKAGYFRAQTDVASLLVRGKGCSQDKKAAFDWFLAAANQGHDRAQYNVALILEYGDGVDRDLQTKIKK